MSIGLGFNGGYNYYNYQQQQPKGLNQPAPAEEKSAVSAQNSDAIEVKGTTAVSDNESVNQKLIDYCVGLYNDNKEASNRLNFYLSTYNSYMQRIKDAKENNNLSEEEKQRTIETLEYSAKMLEEGTLGKMREYSQKMRNSYDIAIQAMNQREYAEFAKIIGNN